MTLIKLAGVCGIVLLTGFVGDLGNRQGVTVSLGFISIIALVALIVDYLSPHDRY